MKEKVIALLVDIVVPWIREFFLVYTVATWFEEIDTCVSPPNKCYYLPLSLLAQQLVSHYLTHPIRVETVVGAALKRKEIAFYDIVVRMQQNLSLYDGNHSHQK